MTRAYPRLGEYRRPKPNSTRRCLICRGCPAGIQFVQVNWFRGDDEACACCTACARVKRSDADELAKMLLVMAEAPEGKEPT